MNTKTTLPISDARKKIFKIAEEVQKPSTFYTLTEKGRPKVVLMSAEEFDSLMENLEILSDPKIMANIKKAEEEFEKGEYQSWEEVKKELGLGRKETKIMLVREKPKKKYRTSRK